MKWHKREHQENMLLFKTAFDDIHYSYNSGDNLQARTNAVMLFGRVIQEIQNLPLDITNTIWPLPQLSGAADSSQQN